MAAFLRAEVKEYEEKIHVSQAQTLGAYMDQIRVLNEDSGDEWVLIVSQARAAGLEKDDLCRELSCSWSTITRWMAGQTAPGVFARRAIKAKLLSMLEELQTKELQLAEQPELALSVA